MAYRRRRKERRKEELIGKLQGKREHIVWGFSGSILELRMVITFISQPIVNAILKYSARP